MKDPDISATMGANDLTIPIIKESNTIEKVIEIDGPSIGDGDHLASRGAPDQDVVMISGGAPTSKQQQNEEDNNVI